MKEHAGSPDLIQAMNTAHFDAMAFVYDEVMSERTVDIPFWVEEARAAGGPVLELGCGTGRLLLPIAEAGIEITGVDASHGMLAPLRERIARLDPATARRITVVEGRFPEAIPDRKYRQIFMAFGVLQYVITDYEAVLRRLHDLLEPGGRLIVDVRHYRFSLEERVVKPVEVYYTGDTRVQEHRVVLFDALTQLLTEEMTWKRYPSSGGEAVETTQTVMRVYNRFELEYLLRLCGFHVRHVYGDYGRNPVSLERQQGSSRRFIYVAER